VRQARGEKEAAAIVHEHGQIAAGQIAAMQASSRAALARLKACHAKLDSAKTALEGSAEERWIRQAEAVMGLKASLSAVYADIKDKFALHRWGLYSSFQALVSHACLTCLQTTRPGHSRLENKDKRFGAYTDLRTNASLMCAERGYRFRRRGKSMSLMPFLKLAKTHTLWPVFARRPLWHGHTNTSLLRAYAVVRRLSPPD
jgi:hypothetical protein